MPLGSDPTLHTINRNRNDKNYHEFLKAVVDVKNLLPAAGASVDHDSALELIKLFADTWFSLDAYDKDELAIQGATKKKAGLTGKKLSAALVILKHELIAKGEATDIFGLERNKDSIEAIVGNVMQSFDGQDLYPHRRKSSAIALFCNQESPICRW